MDLTEPKTGVFKFIFWRHRNHGIADIVPVAAVMQPGATVWTVTFHEKRVLS